jgi:hypothetical protein
LAEDVENAIVDCLEKVVSLRAEADEIENTLAARAERVIDDFLHAT